MSSELLPENFYETPFPNFGKHAGIPVKDVPLDYMDYMLGQWEEKGFGNFMHGEHDDFFVNLNLYMQQDSIQAAFEKERPDLFE